MRQKIILDEIVVKAHNKLPILFALRKLTFVNIFHLLKSYAGHRVDIQLPHNLLRRHHRNLGLKLHLITTLRLGSIQKRRE